MTLSITQCFTARAAAIAITAAMTAAMTMALSGCSEPQAGKNAAAPASNAGPLGPRARQDMSLYDIQGPPNPLWDRKPIDPAKMLTLTYIMNVELAGRAVPQKVEIRTLGYCESVEDESDYAEQCKKIIGDKLAWHAKESLEESSPFDLHIATANPAIRPYALFDKPAMIRALGGFQKIDLYTVLSLKPQ